MRAFNPNVRHLRIFIEVANKSSFRKAAQLLHLSEPTASQAIAQLEEQLEAKLFTRTTRSIELTEVGKEFLSDVERLIFGLDQTIKNIKEYTSTGRGKVSLACLSSIAYRILPPVLQMMSELYPNTNVLYRDENVRGIFSSLDSGECDVAIVSDDVKSNYKFDTTLLHDTYQVVIPANHPLSKKSLISGKDLEKYSVLHLRNNSGVRNTFDDAMEKAGLTPKIIHETTQISTLLGLVESGLGLTVLPGMMCPANGNNNICIRPLARPIISRKIGIIYSPKKLPTIAAQLLANLIKGYIYSNEFELPPGVKCYRQ